MRCFILLLTIEPESTYYQLDSYERYFSSAKIGKIDYKGTVLDRPETYEGWKVDIEETLGRKKLLHFIRASNTDTAPKDECDEMEYRVMIRQSLSTTNKNAIVRLTSRRRSTMQR